MEELIIPSIMSGEHKNTVTKAIKEYSERLFGFIKRRVASNEDAEDILQEVFYQLAGNTKPIDQLTAWLFATTRNKITDSYRKKKPELFDDVFPVDEEDGEFSWSEILFTSHENPESDYLQNLFWKTLYQALDELPAEQKDAFVQHELNDVSFDEMSRQSGIPVATLISRKRYAVLHLRERLQLLKDELLNY
jgi:RNA polymerase sigma factor (sigma-70 family)